VLGAAPQSVSPPPKVPRALSAISINSLKGNLSFIASELLEGRDTPSRGLDIAAQYIAAQFRKAGLEPAGDDGYLQTAKMLAPAAPPEGFALRFQEGSRTLATVTSQTTVVVKQPLDLSGLSLYKVGDAADLKAADLRGKAVEIDEPAEGTHALAKAAAALHPAAFLEPSDDGNLPSAHALIDPDEERAVFAGVPRLIIRDPAAVRLLREARKRETGITVSIHLDAPKNELVTARNVAGLLRGSDPLLRDRYVIVSAHYDHIGRNSAGQIDPGANDDGSGTVSVIEIAQALARLPVHPKRSILFLLFFGEEEGSVGARYYAGHPLFPLSHTIADLNLEQVGRTDSTAGPQLSNATLTGFRYSSVARTLQEAGELTGVKVYETPNDGEYFSRSDNLPFAEHGIPAHTIVVALDFPGYHEPGDVWQKIDYGNMAKVDRMVAMAAILLADGPQPPQWNRSNPNVSGYLRAR
jgi:hypothetical protein